VATYKDADGNECTLIELCCREPSWAANRIFTLACVLNELRKTIDTLADLNFYNAMWDQKQRAEKAEAECERLRGLVDRALDWWFAVPASKQHTPDWVEDILLEQLRERRGRSD